MKQQAIELARMSHSNQRADKIDPFQDQGKIVQSKRTKLYQPKGQQQKQIKMRYLFKPLSLLITLALASSVQALNLPPASQQTGNSTNEAHDTAQSTTAASFGSDGGGGGDLAPLSIEQLPRPILSAAVAQPTRKLIRSRYRLKTADQQQQLVNYSQPFDAPARQQPVLARALAQHQADANVDFPISYTYMAAPSQRAAVVHSSLAETGGGSSGQLMLDEPTAYNQDSLLDYSGPMQAFPGGGRGYSALTAARLSAAASDQQLQQQQQQYSPSSSSAAAPHDYYGSTSLDHPQHDHYDTLGRNSNPLLANYSEYHASTLPYYGALGSSQYPFDFLAGTHGLAGHHHHNSMAGQKNRWSWPWTDISNFGNHYGNPMTAATFKKHYHHHHHAPKEHHIKEHHDEGHHHEEHEHLQSKWEHGISIGEIACIAIAVVLGIIILGSPFFLLFLMLFNGGNLFGTTQMGLLAPAGGQPTQGAAGRRRRKRSLELSQLIGEKLKNGFSQKELEQFLEKLNLTGGNGGLFEGLSSLLDADKLMRSFTRIMDVREDIDRIVAKLDYDNRFQDAAKRLLDIGGATKSADSNNGKRDEMRRRRKK